MRARRIAFKLLTTASLLLAVGVVGLWAQSYQQIDQLTFHPWRIYRIDSGDGVLCIEYFHLIHREREVRVIDSTTVPVQWVPKTEFTERRIGYADSLYAARRAATPISTPWWGKSGDWRIVPWAEKMSLVVWVQTLVPQLPQIIPLSSTIIDEVPDRASVGSQHQEQVIGRAIWLPYWFLLLLCSFMPLLWLRQRMLRSRAKSRSSRNLCPACGYDLRATPTRCPECGHVPLNVK